MDPEADELRLPRTASTEMPTPAVIYLSAERYS